jgi:oxygen-independent coproporphyrinogen-3 oxidase
MRHLHFAAQSPMNFGIYLHLPFCRRRCPYCDFYKKVPRQGELESFPDFLEKELEGRAVATPFSGLEARSIYFGGGTPSLHSPEQVRQIIGVVQRLWRVSDNAEVTLEANPGTVGLGELRDLKASGVNRLSLGLQSFSQRKLRQLYRDHESWQCLESFRLAREAGFDNISVDLIFGVPAETLKEWQDDLKQALRLEPEHISLYNLEYHPDTPFFRWREKGLIVPLDEEIELEMYLSAHEKLANAGYEHYEISNFARPGFRSRHNELYWTGGAYLGAGPSAHSYDGERERTANHPDLYAWQQAVLSDGGIAKEREHLTHAQSLLEWLALNLRRVEGVTYEYSLSRLGKERTDALWQMGSQIKRDLLDFSARRLALTPQGWFSENEIVVKLYKAFDIKEHRSPTSRS